VVDLDGKVIRERAKPSYETDVHYAMYRKRNNINAVVHVHPPHALALSAADLPVAAWCDEGLILEGVPIVLRVDYNRQQQINYILEALGENGKCVMVRCHGAFVGGVDLDEAFLYALEVEEAARIQWLASQLPSATPIPMDEAARLGHPSKVKY
jgi:L-fuculose-phosphate aldolase